MEACVREPTRPATQGLVTPGIDSPACGADRSMEPDRALGSSAAHEAAANGRIGLRWNRCPRAAPRAAGTPLRAPPATTLGCANPLVIAGRGGTLAAQTWPGR